MVEIQGHHAKTFNCGIVNINTRLLAILINADNLDT